jgi:hypothetical protein
MPANSMADQHVDMAEPAREMADHGARQVDQAVGDAGRVHQVGREQEERHREQDEGVVGFEHLREKDERREAWRDEEYRDAGETQRERDRDPQQDEHAKGAEQDQRDLARAHRLVARPNAAADRPAGAFAC